MHTSSGQCSSLSFSIPGGGGVRGRTGAGGGAGEDRGGGGGGGGGGQGRGGAGEEGNPLLQRLINFHVYDPILNPSVPMDTHLLSPDVPIETRLLSPKHLSHVKGQCSECQHVFSTRQTQIHESSVTGSKFL